MKILVTGGEHAERLEMLTTLQASGHTVLVAEDSRTLMPILQQKAPDAAFVLSDSAEEPPSLLLHLVRYTGSPAPHVVVVARDPTEQFLRRAYESGAESDLRRPYSGAYLNARVDVIRRRVEPDRRPPPPMETNRPPARPVVTLGSALDLVSRAMAWSAAPESLKNATGQFLTLPVFLSEAPVDAKLDLACAITMSNVKQELELRVAVGASEESAKCLAAHMFGPEGDDLTADLLNEITNIFMGTMKTAFGAESLAFSSGVPGLIDAAQALHPATIFRLQNAFALNVEGARLIVHLGVGSQARLKVSTGSLVEGMVLAHDVFNMKGVLVVSGGTRLSLNMIERLRGFLPPRHPLEVMA